jgi:hypothetical protein
MNEPLTVCSTSDSLAFSRQIFLHFSFTLSLSLSLSLSLPRPQYALS